jgi:hypothetical protein
MPWYRDDKKPAASRGKLEDRDDEGRLSQQKCRSLPGQRREFSGQLRANVGDFRSQITDIFFSGETCGRVRRRLIYRSSDRFCLPPIKAGTFEVA